MYTINIYRIIAFIFLLLIISCPGFCAEGLSTDAPEDIYQRADEYFERGLFGNAEKDYLKIIEQDPSYVIAYNNLGVIKSMDESTLRDSILYFLRCININPRYADPYSNLGIICYKINNMDKAIMYMERAILLEPKNHRYYFNLGWIYLMGVKEYEKALEYFREAVRVNPSHADSQYALGLAYVALAEKIMVLEQITRLRSLNREELAKALEDLIRAPYIKQEPVYSQIETDYEITRAGGAVEKPAPLREKAAVSIPVRLSGSANIQFKLQGVSSEGTEQ